VKFEATNKKFILLRFSEIFSPVAENFKAKFYIVCSYLWQITKFSSIISKFDRVVSH